MWFFNITFLLFIFGYSTYYKPLVFNGFMLSDIFKYHITSLDTCYVLCSHSLPYDIKGSFPHCHACYQCLNKCLIIIYLCLISEIQNWTPLLKFPLYWQGLHQKKVYMFKLKLASCSWVNGTLHAFFLWV